MNSKQLDMLICVVPKIMPDAPTVGPAVLKAHLNEAGFSCEIVDLNVKLFNEFRKHGDEDYFFEKDSIFKTRDVNLLDSNFGHFYEKYKYVFDEWVNFFKQKNPRFIGLSLLSVMSTTVALKLSLLIREHLPETKIVWGGAEVSVGRTQDYKESGLLDHYISGDGEIPIVDLLSGNLDVIGIDSNGPSQMKNLDEVRIPNYDDISWEEYPYLTTPKPVYITGSRGCVKRCDFCNVYEIWPKYTFRSGENIAKEIITLKEKYDRTTFKFTDSLINGSMKAFRNLLTTLADYNSEKNSDIRWSSQWIIRNKGQSPETDYKLMKESGCYTLDVGIESFSEKIRFELGKKFTDEDMWWCFDMLQKYKIHHTMLMFVGYPTETEEDHQITLNTIRKLHEVGYATARDDEGKRLVYFSFANTLMLDDSQPLWLKVKDEIKDYKNEFNWTYRDNTLDVRLRRLEEVNDLLVELSGQQRTWMVKKKIEMIKKSFG